MCDLEGLSPGLQKRLWFHLQISPWSANFKIPQSSEQLLVHPQSQDKINIPFGILVEEKEKGKQWPLPEFDF